MPNQHIKEYLDYYIQSKNPEHAVMINGAWGSGKTWFIKDYVDNYEQPEDEIKFVHVSLYGLKTTEDIDNEIFRQAFPVLSSKPMVIGKAVAKGFIRGFLKIDLDGDGKDDSQIKLDEMEGAFSTKDLSSDNLILIFDDVERTSIDTIELLGYVNHFVEIQGYKAILISNEKALRDKWENESEQKKNKILHDYSKIKGKLVGKILPITPDYNSAIDIFIENIENDLARQTFENNKEIIIIIFYESAYNNLRLIKKSLLDFSWIISSFDKSITENDNFINHFLKLFFIYNIELTQEDTAALESLENYITIATYGRNHKGETTDNTIKRLEKYNCVNATYPLLPTAVWIYLLFHIQHIPKQDIHTAIINTNHFYDSSTPAWLKLWNFYELESSDFEKIKIIVLDQFENNKFDEPHVALHVMGILLHLTKLNLINLTEQEIYEHGITIFDHMLLKGLLYTEETAKNEYEHMVRFETWHDHGYHSLDNDHFTGLINHLKNKQIEAKNLFLRQKSKELFSTYKCDPTLFSTIILESDKKEKMISNKPILQFFDCKKFATKFATMTTAEKKDIITTFDFRYGPSSCRYLLEEIPWLDKLKQALNDEAINWKKQLASVHFSLFDKTLGKALKNLKEEQKHRQEEL